MDGVFVAVQEMIDMYQVVKFAFEKFNSIFIAVRSSIHICAFSCSLMSRWNNVQIVWSANASATPHTRTHTHTQTMPLFNVAFLHTLHLDDCCFRRVCSHIVVVISGVSFGHVGTFIAICIALGETNPELMCGSREIVNGLWQVIYCLCAMMFL